MWTESLQFNLMKPIIAPAIWVFFYGGPLQKLGDFDGQTCNIIIIDVWKGLCIFIFRIHVIEFIENIFYNYFFRKLFYKLKLLKSYLKSNLSKNIK